MRNRKAPKIRQAMSLIAGEKLENGTTPSEVLEAFLERHRELLVAEQNDLIDIALHRLAGDTTRPRMGTGAENQIDLFDGLARPRTINLWTMANGQMRQIMRSLTSVTLDELRFHEARQKERARRLSDKQSSTSELIERMEARGAHGNSRVGDIR